MNRSLARAMPPLPDLRTPDALRAHVLQTMAFYDGRCVDPSGGFFHCFKDDGRVDDPHTRHLVSSTRFVVTHAWAARHFPAHPRAAAWRDAAVHGLRFLQQAHRQPSGGYAWLLHWQDGRATAALMERHFWEPAAQLYADEADARWQVSGYRGQNANMHACEAMLAAFDATSDERYLQRASAIAESVTVRLASQAGGLIWEHYDAQWRLDPDYHRDDPAHLFRPWGFQTGHLTEWAKLLLTLEARQPDAQTGLDRVGRARRLFDAAWRQGWDATRGGLVYGFAGITDAAGHDGRYAVCDPHKYFWVQAESIAAAARIALRCTDDTAWSRYEQLWAYAWQHFIDHRHGAWYRILAADNTKLDDDKSPPGKTDYHTMGACYDVLEALDAARG